MPSGPGRIRLPLRYPSTRSPTPLLTALNASVETLHAASRFCATPACAYESNFTPAISQRSLVSRGCQPHQVAQGDEQAVRVQRNQDEQEAEHETAGGQDTHCQKNPQNPAARRLHLRT